MAVSDSGGYADAGRIRSCCREGISFDSGSYQSGRVIRINPDDKSAERALVRTFDRETGLSDEGLEQGKAAAQNLLKRLTSNRGANVR